MHEYAQLDTSTKTPTSARFDDIYFSPDDGIGESRYHFIDGNHLPQRFHDFIQLNDAENNHKSRDFSSFTIAETGFGTGLNFLLTTELWQQSYDLVNPSQPKHLHYISTEKYPIHSTELATIYSAQGWNSEVATQLLSDYSRLLAHNTDESDENNENTVFELAINEQITLTLLLGDAATQLATYEFQANAWFLDGFAPSKNPDMWTPSLFQTMAKHSQSGTTFATFTAASKVRRGLQEAGFNVNKGKGFGRKRERLLGEFQPD